MLHPYFVETEQAIFEQYERIEYATDRIIQRSILLGMLYMASSLNLIPEFRIKYWTKKI